VVRVPQPPTARSDRGNHQLPPGRPHGGGRILTTGDISGLACRAAGSWQLAAMGRGGPCIVHGALCRCVLYIFTHAMYLRSGAIMATHPANGGWRMEMMEDGGRQDGGDGDGGRGGCRRLLLCHSAPLRATATATATSSC
jgi:hypothetical protein